MATISRLDHFSLVCQERGALLVQQTERSLTLPEAPERKPKPHRSDKISTLPNPNSSSIQISTVHLTALK